MWCCSEAQALFQGSPMDTHSVPLVSLLPTAHEVWFVCLTADHHGFGKGFLLLPQCCTLQLCCQKVLVVWLCWDAWAAQQFNHAVHLPASSFWWQKWSSSCRLYFCCKRLGVFTALFLFTLSTFWIILKHHQNNLLLYCLQNIILPENI